jgi:hypothetical protein
MSKRNGLILLLLLAALFLILNRGAYKGYFQDDEIDLLSGTPGWIPPGILHIFGLRYPFYVAFVQIFHLLNVWLLWVLIRRVGSPPLPAVLGCFFYAIHAALFDAVWKPTYLFDVLCGTLCLLSILMWTRHRRVLSIACFVLACGSEELAVMLPFALLCYEWWLGERRWKPLIPFFLVSLLFVVLGLLRTPAPGAAYALRLTPESLTATSEFYASRFFLIPYLGFLLPIAALMTRDRRVWFGLAMAGLLLLPLLFLPGRLSGAYCYVPFIGLALALAGLMESSGRIWLAAALLAAWLPLDYLELRSQRRATLANADAVRAWIGTLSEYSKGRPAPQTFLYAGTPGGYHPWGVEGALHYVYPAASFEVHPLEDAAAGQLDRRRTVLAWNGATRKLDTLELQPGQRDASHLELAGAAPAWQLEDGWYVLEGTFRWIAPTATARLQRPDGARQFELRVLAGPELLQKSGPVTVHVSLNDRELEPHRFTDRGWQTAVWALTPEPAGSVQVTIRTDPPFRPENDPRVLGIAVGALGFR